jgi:flagellar motor switch protein FliG
MNYRQIAKGLLQEHPQTIAVALARLEPEHSSEIIKLLPTFIHADLISRIVRIDQLPDEVLEEVDLLLNSLLKRC